MTKIVDFDRGKKPPATCPYCGKEPACVDFTCPRIKRVASDDSGAWDITFFRPKDPSDGDEAA